MSRIVIALASFLFVSPPRVMGKEVPYRPEPKVEIVTVTKSDLTVDGAPTRILKVLKPSEYKAVIDLATSKDGRNGEHMNIREYILNDSLGYKHDVFVTFMPKDVPWTDRAFSRPMQIDVFVSGPASFTYALSETTGYLVYDCRCPSSTPMDLRTKNDSIILSAVDSMVTLGKKRQ